jgi:hypothetical protein
MEARPLDDDAFTGSDPCADVPGNRIIRDSANDHNDAYNDTIEACYPGSGGAAAPGFSSQHMIVYVFGTATGCDAMASVEEVRDCGTGLEVDYRVEATGSCASSINAWASAWVLERDLPVHFNQLP